MLLLSAIFHLERNGFQVLLANILCSFITYLDFWPEDKHVDPGNQSVSYPHYYVISKTVVKSNKKLAEALNVYKNVENNSLENINLDVFLDINKRRERIAHLNNVAILEGLIRFMDSPQNGCKVQQNNGCHHKDLLKTQSLLSFHATKNFNPNIEHFNKLIVISAQWCNSIWHFPMECLVALSSVPANILNDTKIHVNARSKYVLEWLELIGIHESQVCEMR